MTRLCLNNLDFFKFRKLLFSLENSLCCFQICISSEYYLTIFGDICNGSLDMYHTGSGRFRCISSPVN